MYKEKWWLSFDKNKIVSPLLKCYKKNLSSTCKYGQWVYLKNYKIQF